MLDCSGVVVSDDIADGSPAAGDAAIPMRLSDDCGWNITVCAVCTGMAYVVTF